MYEGTREWFCSAPFLWDLYFPKIWSITSLMVVVRLNIGKDNCTISGSAAFVVLVDSRTDMQIMTNVDTKRAVSPSEPST
jgi:hypothetical protein